MTLLANALLALRAGLVNHHQWLIVLLGAILLLGAAAVTAFGTLRRGQLASGMLTLAAHSGMIGGTALFARKCRGNRDKSAAGAQLRCELLEDDSAGKQRQGRTDPGKKGALIGQREPVVVLAPTEN